MLKKIKKFFGFGPKKPTLNEMIEFINKEYHFNQHDENLISEIYTLLLDYGSINVIKKSEHRYILELTCDKIYTYEVTETGIAEHK